MNDSMQSRKEPALASLVAAGMAPQDAVDLGDGIFMSRGVSNCYQVATRDAHASPHRAPDRRRHPGVPAERGAAFRGRDDDAVARALAPFRFVAEVEDLSGTERPVLQRHAMYPVPW